MRRLALPLLALFAAGCLDLDFDPPHLIKEARIIGLRPEPPEAQFGEDVVFTTLIVDETGADLSEAPDVELRWTVCVSLAAIIRGAGLGAGSELDDDCREGGEDLIRLDTEGLPPNAARLPGAEVLAVVAQLMMPGPGGPMPEPVPGLEPGLIDSLLVVIAEVGVPLSVRLEVYRQGEQILVGFKRFAITMRADPTTNPPPPRFSLDGAFVSARDGDDPTLCVPEGDALTVEAGAEVALDPDDDEEAWLETYPVFNFDGVVQENEESAYYSWFVTAGSVADDITQRPNDDTTWTAPEEPGTYPLWVVVRDGHLGMSWCRVDVVVR